MFTSVLTYCLPVFGGCEKSELGALQVMQNKAARLVTHMPFRTPRKELFSQLDWLTVRQLVFYHSALSTFRVRQAEEPEYLNTLMSRDGKTGRINIPNTTLTLAKKSYCVRGATQWNMLPDYIRNTQQTSQFKTQLKKWIKLNIPQFLDT